MRALGIDPGLKHVGWSLVHWPSVGKPVLLAAGVIHVDSRQPLPPRLRDIAHSICAIAGEHRPLCVGVEETFVNRNAQTSLALAQARAAAIIGVYHACVELPFYAFAPATVKKAVTGRGSADKQSVARAVRALLGNTVVESMRHDATDAAAVALCTALRHQGQVAQARAART